jgi:hypothetical protein
MATVARLDIVLQGVTKGFEQSMTRAAASVGNLATKMKVVGATAYAAVQAANAAFGSFAGSSTLAAGAAGITALGLALGPVGVALNGVARILSVTFAAGAATAGVAVRGFINIAKTAFSGLLSIAQSITTPLAALWNKIGPAMGSALGTAVGIGFKVLVGAAKLLLAPWMLLGKLAAEAFRIGLDAAGGLLGGLVGALGKTAALLGQAVAGVMGTVAGALGTALGAIFGAVVGVVGAVAGGLASTLGSVLGSAIALIGSALSGLAQIAGTVVVAALQTVISTVSALAGAFAMLAGGAIKTALSRFSDIAAMGRLSARLGIGTKTLAALDLAAAKSGQSVEELARPMEHVQRIIAEAATGSQEAGNAFRRLGLDAQALSQLSIDQAFIQVATALERVGNAAERNQLGFQLIGKQSGGLRATLAILAGGMDGLRAKAERMGTALSLMDTQTVMAAKRALGEIEKTWEGFKNKVAVAMAPAIQRVAEQFSAMLQSIKIDFESLGDYALKGVLGAEFAIRNLGEVWKAVAGDFSIVWRDTLAEMQSYAAFFAQQAADIFYTLGAAVSGVFDTISTEIGLIFSEVAGYARKLLSVLTSIASAAGTMLAPQTTNAITSASSVLAAIDADQKAKQEGNPKDGFFAKAAAAFKEGFDTFKSNMDVIMAQKRDLVMKDAAGAMGGLGAAALKGDVFKGGVNDLAAKMQEHIEKAFGKLKPERLFGNIANQFGDVLGLNAFFDTKKLGGGLLDFLGGFTVKQDPIAQKFSDLFPSGGLLKDSKEAIDVIAKARRAQEGPGDQVPGLLKQNVGAVNNVVIQAKKIVAALDKAPVLQAANV